MTPTTERKNTNSASASKTDAAAGQHRTTNRFANLPPKKHRSSFAKWLDKVRCERTVKKWKRTQRVATHRFSLLQKLQAIPHAHELGNALYMVGFWAEYALVCAARTLRRVWAAVAANVGALLGMILRPLGMGILTLLEDLTRPFARLISGFRHMREIAEEKPELAGKEIRREKIQYFKRGTKIYLPLVWQAASYLLPILAAVALVITVRVWMDRTFVLDVQVNGQSVGYVESEQVFESAREDVQSRINSAKAAMSAAGAEVSDARWELNPTYTLAISGETMSESEVTDAILRTSSNEIANGTAVYVDGVLMYVTSEGDHLRTFLESVKRPYEDKSNANVRVEFASNIKLVDGVYFKSSLMPYGDIINSLKADGDPLYYTATDGETMETLEETVKQSLESLQALNPQITGQDYELTPGEQILIFKNEARLLQVKTIEQTTYDSPVQFSSVTSDSDEYDYGKTVTVQEGVDGVEQITADIVTVNGVTTTNIVNRTRIQDPVDELILKGTKLKSGMIASGGSGTWIWPVPGYTYVSRWMSASHRGADICAPYGTAILASDGGVVTTAGWHYSYGNYVVIDHGNGYTTLYAHMSQILVSTGQAVSQGQQIGCVGSTGNSTGNHCHFEMYYNGVRFSAYQYFAGM